MTGIACITWIPSIFFEKRGGVFIANAKDLGRLLYPVKVEETGLYEGGGG